MSRTFLQENVDAAHFVPVAETEEDGNHRRQVKKRSQGGCALLPEIHAAWFDLPLHRVHATNIRLNKDGSASTHRNDVSLISAIVLRL
jgi:hypothetical protein